MEVWLALLLSCFSYDIRILYVESVQIVWFYWRAWRQNIDDDWIVGCSIQWLFKGLLGNTSRLLQLQAIIFNYTLHLGLRVDSHTLGCFQLLHLFYHCLYGLHVRRLYALNASSRHKSCFWGQTWSHGLQLHFLNIRRCSYAWNFICEDFADLNWFHWDVLNMPWFQPNRSNNHLLVHFQKNQLPWACRKDWF